MISHIIYDLDGTLIDSVRDVVNSLKQAYKKINVDLIIPDEKKIMGPPLQEIIQILTPDISAEMKKKVNTEFRSIYDNLDYNETYLISGAFEILNKFKSQGKKQFVATSKAKTAVFKIMDKLQIMDYFNDVATVDMFNDRKVNKTEMLNILKKRNNLPISRTLVIGDTHFDIEAARENGMISVAFTGGYGSRESMSVNNPDFIISALSGLIGVVSEN
jgi:phosphoglycolate phosphatase